MSLSFTKCFTLFSNSLCSNSILFSWLHITPTVQLVETDKFYISDVKLPLIQEVVWWGWWGSKVCDEGEVVRLVSV